MEQSSISAVYENEIDLARLGKLLWQKKWIILGGTFLAAILTFLYILLPKQTLYRSQINFTSPFTNDLAALNTQLNNHPLLKPISVAEASNLFQTIAFSDLTKANFLKHCKQQPSIDKNFLPRSIQIQLKQGNFFTVSIISANPNSAVNYVKDYVAFVHTIARHQLSSALNQQLDSFFEENHTDALTNLPQINKFEFNMNNAYLAHIEDQVELLPVLSKFTRQRMLFFSLAVGFMLSCVIIIIFDFKSLLITQKD